jgi:tetratricopeptide (TPR) repeat protein
LSLLPRLCYHRKGALLPKVTPMRNRQLPLLLLAIYLVFVGGSAYYALIFPVRVLHHVVVTLVLALWLVGRLRRGQGLPQTPLNRPLYAAVVVWLVSAVASSDPRMAFEHLWFPITHGLFFFALADFIQRGRQRQLFEIQFFLAALVVIITGLELASWYFGLGIVPGTSVGWTDVLGPDLPLPLEILRVSLAMNISTLLAGYVAPLVVVTLGWALTAHRRYRAVLLMLAAALAVVLALTMSRGGYLSAAAGVATLVVLRASVSSWVTQRLSARTLLAAGGLALLAGGVGFAIISATPGRTSGDLGRLDMWQSAVRLTAAHPLTGVGPGLFGPAFRLERTPTLVQDKLASAHNVVLNNAAETGLPGLAVSLWLVIAFVRGWWRQRMAASGGRQFRLDVCFAALVGLAVHSMVDVFTITPIMLTIALLAAYCVVTPRRGFDIPPSAHRVTALVALLIVLGYGAWLALLDVAQNRYQASLGGGDGALEAVQEARALDPGLRLYGLQEAYLAAQTADLPTARALYTQALALDPTWDTGWLNFAALAEADDDLPAALEATSRAMAINSRSSSATLHWARLAEALDAAPDEDIIAAYMRYPILLTNDWWTETPLRREALEQVADGASLDMQYRIWAAHDPARAAALVPDAPVTVADWWVVGQAALDEGDAAGAEGAFTQAIALSPRDGDLYASRARARAITDRAAAQRDLMLAELLGVVQENLNDVRLLLTDDPAERERLIAASTQRTVSQAFAAVVYGRPAAFDVLPAMQGIGIRE